MNLEEIKKAIANLSNDERDQLFNELNLEARKEVSITVKFNDWDLAKKNAPTITCTYKGKIETINVYEKIKEDPCSLAHPLIQLCIWRWSSFVHRKHLVSKEDFSIAKDHLKKVGIKLLEGIESRILPKEIAFLLNINKLEIDYLKTIWEISNTQEIKQNKNSLKKRKLIEEHFLKQIPVFPDIVAHKLQDEQSLENRVSLNLTSTNTSINPNASIDLPLGTTGFQAIRLCLDFIETESWQRKKSWESFRNTYIAWKYWKKNNSESSSSLQQDSIKKYISVGRKKIKQLFNKGLNRYSEDELFKYGAIYSINKPLANDKMIYQTDLNLFNFKITKDQLGSDVDELRKHYLILDTDELLKQHLSSPTTDICNTLKKL